MRSLAFIVLLGLFSLMFFTTGCRPPEVEGVIVDIQHGMFDKAMEGAKKAVELYPDNAEAWYYLGYLHGRKGEYKEMNKALDKALSINPNQGVKFQGNSMPLKEAVKRMRLHYFGQNYNSAVKDYNKANQIDDQATRMKLLKSAAQKFEAAHEADPSRMEPLQPLAFSYLQIGDTTSAEKYFLEALNAKPHNDTLLVMVGEFYLQIGNTQKAADMFKRALQINPKSKNALISMGQLMATQSKWKEAVDYFEKVIEMDPQNKDVAFNLGLGYYQLEKYDKAITYLKRTLEAEPDNEKIYELMGVCYVQGKMYEEGLPFLKSAVQKFPNNMYLWNYLAVTYANLNMKQEAEEAYQKAKALGGDNVQ